MEKYCQSNLCTFNRHAPLLNTKIIQYKYLVKILHDIYFTNFSPCKKILTPCLPFSIQQTAPALPPYLFYAGPPRLFLRTAHFRSLSRLRPVGTALDGPSVHFDGGVLKFFRKLRDRRRELLVCRDRET